MENEFVDYLNSLNNITAAGANALAESQSMSPYFEEIYQPFPIVGEVVDMLASSEDCVIILSGHAGDGKTTFALDVLRKLRGERPEGSERSPLKEREDISDKSISVVKDMSELSAERRHEWLQQAFSEKGSWLIVSNTGPLLQSLLAYSSETLSANLESEILAALDSPICIDANINVVNGLPKKLIILNLARLDNVEMGTSVLSLIAQHSAWKNCEGCPSFDGCPIRNNKECVLQSGEVVRERIGLIYRLLYAYEHRLTMRQIVAQISYSFTGGLGCSQVQNGCLHGVDTPTFSENYFGHRAGYLSEGAGQLHAISILSRQKFGLSAGVQFDRRMSSDVGMGWANLPKANELVIGEWQSRCVESDSVNWRAAIRRAVYLFGEVKPDRSEEAGAYVDGFLRSQCTRAFDRWERAGELQVSATERKHFVDMCLQVLLEEYSGFSSRQFDSPDSLYLTLRRPDRAVVQPTQLVIDVLSFRDFRLDYDSTRRCPVLDYKKGEVRLHIELPLYDYMSSRHRGVLGKALSPIYRAQIEWFRAELLRVSEESRRSPNELELLRAGIDGAVKVHRFLLDEDQQRLEFSQ